jgi:hypothetical protein
MQMQSVLDKTAEGIRFHQILEEDSRSGEMYYI